MPASTARAFLSTRSPSPALAELVPGNVTQLKRALEAKNAVPGPIRPQGAGTASTDCNRVEKGTVLNLAGLDRIVNIDTYNHTVTAQAGVRLGKLARALAEHGLEFVGGYDLQNRTLGGAISAPCFGPSIGTCGSYFSSHVSSMKLVTANGGLLDVTAEREQLLSALRMSYGMLGVIAEATLQVRPIRTFSASHRRVSIERFSSVIDTLANAGIGLKFYLMPYRDRVYLDLRRYEADVGTAYRAPWSIKDWGESTVLPHVFKSLNRVVPIPSVRYRLIDSIGETAYGLVNSRFVNAGSNAAGQANSRSQSRSNGCRYSTWCFPASDFSMIVKAYTQFCEATLANSRYRCDLPAVGHLLYQDNTALLSPSFDEPMIALTTASTVEKGWEDFVIDLAEFAESWGGTPTFSQSRALRFEYAHQAYADRLTLFRKLRRRLDPNNRLLSPFCGQYCL